MYFCAFRWPGFKDYAIIAAGSRSLGSYAS
jgi:hypothetical protein